MKLNLDTDDFIQQVELVGGIIRKIIITLILLIFGGLISCGFIFTQLENWRSDKACQQQFGEEWSAITNQGDVYGALCKGPNGQNRWSRPRYYQ